MSRHQTAGLIWCVRGSTSAPDRAPVPHENVILLSATFAPSIELLGMPTLYILHAVVLTPVGDISSSLFLFLNNHVLQRYRATGNRKSLINVLENGIQLLNLNENSHFLNLFGAHRRWRMGVGKDS